MKRTHTFHNDIYMFDRLGNMTVERDPRYKFARMVDWVIAATAVGVVGVACIVLFLR